MSGATKLANETADRRYNHDTSEECRLQKITNELVKLGASVRTDSYRQDGDGSPLADMTYLSYRLGTVTERKHPVKKSPDLTWQRVAPGRKALLWKQKSLVLRGDWAQGELNRLTIPIFARELEKKNMHLFHSSAAQYRGKSLLFMSGDSNHGKTMSLIEACNRGGEIIATECLIVDRKGRPLEGSQEVFLKSRSKGTERVDKPEATAGVAKFFKGLPEFKAAKERAKRIEAVVLPSIDGNYDFASSRMSHFEKAYQTFCSLSDFYQANSLVTPTIPMPVIETVELRERRAAFANDFASDRPYYFVKASTPQAVLDEVDRLIESGEIDH